MAHLAAHHTAVAGHRHNLRHAAAGIDAVVGFVAAHIVLLQVFLGSMEGVGVLHGELAHTDQAAAAAGFIPELRLDLVDHERILGIRISHVRHQLDGSFLMGHAKHHIAARTVLEPQQFRADGIIPAGLAPHISGHGDRKQYFLSVDAVHLLADDVFNLRGDALGDGKQRKDAVAHGLDVAAAHHQCLAGNLTVRRSFLETLGYEISDLHKMTSPVLHIKTACPCAGTRLMLRGTTLLDGVCRHLSALYREPPAEFHLKSALTSAHSGDGRPVRR